MFSSAWDHCKNKQWYLPTKYHVNQLSQIAHFKKWILCPLVDFTLDNNVLYHGAWVITI